MHQLAVAFFYTCAVLSITVAALVFIGKVSADDSHHGVRYEIEVAFRADVAKLRERDVEAGASAACGRLSIARGAWE